MSTTDVNQQTAPTADGTDPLAIVNQGYLAAYVAAALAGYSPSVAAPAVVNSTATSYTLSSSNYGGAQTGLLVFTSAGDVTVTVNARTAGGMPVGSSLVVYNGTANTVTLAKGSGTTFRSILGNTNAAVAPGYAVRITKESGSTGTGVAVIDGAATSFQSAKVTGDATAAVAVTAAHFNPVTARGVLTCSDTTPTVTLGNDTDTNVPIGAVLEVVHTVSGVLTFAAGSGAAVDVRESYATTMTGAFCRATAIKVGANAWLVAGELDLEA